MKTKKFCISMAVAMVTAGLLITMGVIEPTAHAQSGHDSRVEQGLQIAPVPLDLNGKDRDLVGLGSYIVNAVASCNDPRGPLENRPMRGASKPANER